MSKRPAKLWKIIVNDGAETIRPLPQSHVNSQIEYLMRRREPFTKITISSVRVTAHIYQRARWGQNVTKDIERFQNLTLGNSAAGEPPTSGAPLASVR